MLTLYYKPFCPYCMRVIAANEQIGAALTLRNVSADMSARAELLAKGGKSQVPYLEDTDRGVTLYESAAIIGYLAEEYGVGVAVSVPEVGNVCPIE